MGWGAPWMVLSHMWGTGARVRAKGTPSTTVRPAWLERLVHLQVGPVASSPPPEHKENHPRAWNARSETGFPGFTSSTQPISFRTVTVDRVHQRAVLGPSINKQTVRQEAGLGTVQLWGRSSQEVSAFPCPAILPSHGWRPCLKLWEMFE